MLSTLASGSLVSDPRARTTAGGRAWKAVREAEEAPA